MQGDGFKRASCLLAVMGSEQCRLDWAMTCRLEGLLHLSLGLKVMGLTSLMRGHEFMLRAGPRDSVPTGFDLREAVNTSHLKLEKSPQSLGPGSLRQSHPFSESHPEL